MKGLNVIEFRNSILEDKKTIVEMGAEWCCNCKDMKRILSNLEPEHPEMAFYSLDVGSNLAVADEYNIDEMPVLIAFKDGKEISRLCWSAGDDVASWLNFLNW